MKLKSIFQKGFNVLTGESGSGKSAILHALSLIQGDKADTSLLRKGCDKGFVEALFSIANNSPIFQLLQESGLDPFESSSDGAQELLLKREIHGNGRTKAFVNNQIAQISLLEKIAEHLFEIVGQHANQSLKTPDQHRQFLDSFGELHSLLQEYRNSWERKTALHRN